MLSHKRDHYCGLLNKENAGQTVHLSGWVQRTRDLGGLVFVWLRDREGLVQLVFDGSDCSKELLELGQSLRSEYVLTVVGEVRLRDESAVNHDLATGEIEVVVREAELLNKSETRPSTSTTRPTRARPCDSSTATSTCASRACSGICACAAG